MAMTDKELKNALTTTVRLDENNFLKSTYENGELFIEASIDDKSPNSKKIIRLQRDLRKTERVQIQLRKFEEQARILKFKDFWKKIAPNLRESWKSYRKENKGCSDITLLKEFIKASGITGVEVIEKTMNK